MAAISAGKSPPGKTGVFAGVELGGTKCVCILAKGPSAILQIEGIPTRRPEETLPRIRDVLSRWAAAHQIAGLGIASFGPLDLDPKSPRFGTLTTTPKPGWSGTNVESIAGSIPFMLDTDVNGAALAEGAWGAARGLRSWSYITVGTGVGVASIVSNASVRGSGHSEAGHMRVPLPSGGFGGTCKFHGNCVEGLISGPALSAWANMEADRIPDDHPIWEQVAQVLAHLCHNLVLTAVPQAIVLGGGIAQKRPFLLDQARQHLRRSLGAYAQARELGERLETFLVAAALGDEAGPLGAIALAQLCRAKPA